MAEALIGGLVGKDIIAGRDIYVSEHKPARRQYLQERYGVVVNMPAEQFVALADVVLFAVKPKDAAAAMAELGGHVKAPTAVVSVVAGLSLADIESYFDATPVFRVMPNTPVAVGAGMSVISVGRVTDKDKEQIVLRLFEAVGRAAVLPETLMDAVTGLSGSGPGYAFVLLDALSDGGVNAGLPRDTANFLAAQTLYGAAKMMLDSAAHPAQLRDMVTSPGGTTIAGIRVLEQRGVRAALIDAVAASADKSRAMGMKKHE